MTLPPLGGLDAWLAAREAEVPLVSSLGFLVLLENLALVTIGSDQQAFPALVPDFNLRLGGLVIGGAQLVSLVAALALVTGMSLVLNRMNLGRQIRSIAASGLTRPIVQAA